MLGVAGALFIFTALAWPFTSQGNGTFGLVLIALLHVAAGISTAGMLLASSNIAMELAPRGAATAYLAANSLTAGAASALAPLLGGLAADWLADRELAFALRWGADGHTFPLASIRLTGLDFLFVASFVFGQYALHRLLAVREEGTVESGVLLLGLRDEVRRHFRSIMTVGGLRTLSSFPYWVLRERPMHPPLRDGIRKTGKRG